MQSSPLPCYVIPLRSNYLSQHAILGHCLPKLHPECETKFHCHSFHLSAVGICVCSKDLFPCRDGRTDAQAQFTCLVPVFDGFVLVLPFNTRRSPDKHLVCFSLVYRVLKKLFTVTWKSVSVCSLTSRVTMLVILRLAASELYLHSALHRTTISKECLLESVEPAPANGCVTVANTTQQIHSRPLD
jgi:hypothetical protein